MPSRYVPHLSLYEMIPEKDMKLPATNILLGSRVHDAHVAEALRQALGKYKPTKKEVAFLLIILLNHVVRHLNKRSTHGRDEFWRLVSQGWEADSGVRLDVQDVRDLSLTITRSERRYKGTKSDKPTEFLSLVRMTNAYFRVNEPESDEAVEILEEFKAMAKAPKVFWARPKIQPIPWSDLTLLPDDFLERVSALSLNDSVAPEAAAPAQTGGNIKPRKNRRKKGKSTTVATPAGEETTSAPKQLSIGTMLRKKWKQRKNAKKAALEAGTVAAANPQSAEEGESAENDDFAEDGEFAEGEDSPDDGESAGPVEFALPIRTLKRRAPSPDQEPEPKRLMADLVD